MQKYSYALSYFKEIVYERLGFIFFDIIHPPVLLQSDFGRLEAGIACNVTTMGYMYVVADKINRYVFFIVFVTLRYKVFLPPISTTLYLVGLFHIVTCKIVFHGIFLLWSYNYFC